MKKVASLFYFLYDLFIFLPLGIAATILCALVTLVMCTIADPNKWGYYPGKIWSMFICYLAFCPVTVEGREKLDPNQSYVFAANHQSLFDIFVIYGFLGINFKWIMKAEAGKIPLVGKACAAAGHIFIDRSKKKAAFRSIEKAKKTIINGTSIVIFPEGTRRKTTEMGHFKKGGFLVAQDLELPIVPLTISGTYEAFPVGVMYIRPYRLRLIIHEPISFKKSNDEKLPELMNAVKEQIASSL